MKALTDAWTWIGFDKADAVMAFLVLLATFWQGKTAVSVRKIEHQRRHDELTPKFEFAFTVPPGPMGRRFVQLHVFLVPGHPGSRDLDGVQIEIVDDTSRRPEGVPSDAVWGPVRFHHPDPSRDGNEPQPAGYDGRRTSRFRLGASQPGAVFLLMRNRDDPVVWNQKLAVRRRLGYGLAAHQAANYFSTPDGERSLRFRLARLAEDAVRLKIECWRKGHKEPWIVQEAVKVVEADGMWADL